MQYWDTSTLAKLYVAESDSTQFQSHLAATGPATTSVLARWEIFRVFARKETESVIIPGAAEVIFAKFEADVTAGRVILLPMDGAVEERFRNLTLRLHRLAPPVFTRTLDAIHLATADSRAAAEFVVTDINLRRCAVTIGLSVSLVRRGRVKAWKRGSVKREAWKRGGLPKCSAPDNLTDVSVEALKREALKREALKRV
jgi:predicted nucleic acid-binding protein